MIITDKIIPVATPVNHHFFVMLNFLMNKLALNRKGIENAKPIGPFARTLSPIAIPNNINPEYCLLNASKIPIKLMMLKFTTRISKHSVIDFSKKRFVDNIKHGTTHLNASYFSLNANLQKISAEIRVDSVIQNNKR